MARGFIISFMLALVLIVPAYEADAQVQRCFPQTGKCISGNIRTYWENTGGLPVYGYPITDLATETNADGFTGPTQWFERDRLEDHSAEGIGILAGRLGAQKLAMENRPWESFPKVPSAPAGCRWFAETGHSLCPPFLAYWEQNNSLTRFGFPISEPMVEVNAAGFSGTFQWFERRRMELHPENQPPYNILLGLLGNEVRGNAEPPPPTGGGGPPQPSADCTHSAPGSCLTLAEAEMARLINDYRISKGLPAIPISRSMTMVAQTHVEDLKANHPDTGTDSRGIACSPHSWSNKGNWTPVCYTNDGRYASAMWSKPQEITGGRYQGKGYEMIVSQKPPVDINPQVAMDGLKGSSIHNAVMLEQAPWVGSRWQAMGVGSVSGYIAIWVGSPPDVP